MSASVGHEIEAHRAATGPTKSWLALSRTAAALAFGPRLSRPFAIRYWDSGVVEPGSPGRTAFTLVLEHPGAMRKLFLPPSELRLAEAYVYGDVDIVGDFAVAARVAADAGERLRSATTLMQLMRTVYDLPKSTDHQHSAKRSLGTARLTPRHSEQRDAAAIRSHYDVGNDFYQLFLDERMIYSCAYFPTGTETLDEAQRAKLEHICRKLRLKPGDRLLDIGCGWGGLIQYASEHYGVHALGITISPAQAMLAIERIAAAGVSDICQVRMCDYRELGDVEPFDKIASVGMAEHVGLHKLPAYFREVFRHLKPGGLFLNHCITHDRHEAHPVSKYLIWKAGTFTSKYVFPDGQLVRFDQLAKQALRQGFEIRGEESLREHYVRTLTAWTQRLEAAKDEAIGMVGDELYRIWRLHTGGAAAGFATGRLTIHQLLLAKPNSHGAVPAMPLTSADIYRS
jgi:cyclopropane-fatty-acyl-phospholipid synthase